MELKFLVRFQAGVPNKMNKENKLTPGLPPGFEDRWNKKLILKKKIINIIETNFVKFGFEPLETPSFEISENIGSFLADDDSNTMSGVFSFKDGEKNITLRYDLSSPLARFVAQNNQELPLPYKDTKWVMCGETKKQAMQDIVNSRKRIVMLWVMLTQHKQTQNYVI